jgi:hypothetical protein
MTGKAKNKGAPILPLNIQPPDLDHSGDFHTIRQGAATNALAKVSSRGALIDTVTGTAIMRRGAYSAIITKYNEMRAGLRTSTAQLLDALYLALTRTSARSPIVTISIRDFMALRGLKNYKEAYHQITDDLELIKRMSLGFTGKGGHGSRDFLDVNICDSKGIENGVIIVKFTDTFFQVIRGYSVMHYPAQLFRLSGKRNPHSYPLLHKLAEHKRMNRHKKNENIISVRALLEAAPDIPTAEEVMRTTRHLNARIIEPFVRDLDALAETLTWEYCHSNGAPLTKEEVENQNYALIITLMIKIFWINYPEEAPLKVGGDAAPTS